MSYPEAVDEILAHFLTDFDINCRPYLLKSYITKELEKTYSTEHVDTIVEKYYNVIQKFLMEEYDSRLKDDQLLRYEFLDAEGTRVKGIGKGSTSRLRLLQNALNSISNAEFERLSAVILKWMGCREVWATPLSHDQGLDAFGYYYGFKKYLPRRCVCTVVMLAQAKHYRKHKVGTKDIREFVGSYDLAVHKIFSTLDAKYSQLLIKPFGPTLLVFLTTQEVPMTFKRLADKAGVVVLAAEDIYYIIIKRRFLRALKWSKSNLVRKLQELAIGPEVASN